MFAIHPSPGAQAKWQPIVQRSRATLAKELGSKLDVVAAAAADLTRTLLKANP